MNESWAFSGDLARGWLWVGLALAVASVVLLAVELFVRRTTQKPSLRVGATGLLAVVLLMLAVLRPVRVFERASTVGARLVVLADASRSIDLPADGNERRRAVAAERGGPRTETIRRCGRGH